MSRRVLCKFFAHGACLKGQHCEFSHDWKDQPNNVCTFYQKGVCSYGSRCRYDHIKVSRHQASTAPAPPPPTATSSSNARPHPTMYSSQLIHASEVVPWSDESIQHLSNLTDASALSITRLSPDKPAWTTQDKEAYTFEPSDHIQHFTTEGSHRATSEGSHHVTSSADQPICSFAAAGNCPYGESCPHLHGDLCSICGKQCLHPYRPDEREEHIKLCEKNNKRLETLRLSQDIECSVCLERVLSKTTAAERKFGLLSECDHPFCISCIRNWRNNSPASGMDVNAALRACPICRKLSYFVIPSVIWYSSLEEKQDIVDNYKAKLKSIDCKYFDFGNGTCPFSTSCFYKHAYRDGRLEEVVLRHLDAEDGKTLIAKDIRMELFKEIGNLVYLEGWPLIQVCFVIDILC